MSLIDRLPSGKNTRIVKEAVKQIFRHAGVDLVPTSYGFSAAMARGLQACDLVLDVGANEGQYGCRVRALGYNGPIMSFEPSSHAAAILTARAAGDRHWDVRQVALGEATGEAVLHVSRNSVSSSLLPILDTHVVAAPDSVVVGDQQVVLRKLDGCEWLPRFSQAWLKLDVQGSEMQVLRGAELTLSRVAYLQCEISLVSLYEGDTNYLTLLQWLRDRGMHARALEPGFEDPETGDLLQADLLLSRSPGTTC